MKKIEINNDLLKSLIALASVIEARDPYTGGHIWRVSRYSILLGEQYGLDKNYLFVLELGALVHDLGKVGVSDGILNKQDSLSEQELQVVRQHPVVGGEISKNHPLYPLVRYSILEHHERVDGTGYPGRLDGDSITIWGKITSIADSFDALTSPRPYRPALPVDRALKILSDGKGTQFDAHLVDLFLSLAKTDTLNHILGHAGENRLLLSCPVCGPLIVPRPDIQEGEILQCPSCTGRFRIHRAGDTFQLEYTGSKSGVYVPRPDEGLIQSILKRKRKTVTL
ncbi:MAG: HD domain-containing protein [Spirochaetes bacterium]|nr:HD domain-containing protein [Spirochaetota bacterium]